MTVGFKNQLKRKALETDSAPIQIASQALASLGPSSDLISNQGRTHQANAKIISRHRKANRASRPNEPSSLEELDPSYFEPFKYTAKGDLFQLYDDGPQVKGRLVMFASRRSLTRILATSSIW